MPSVHRHVECALGRLYHPVLDAIRKGRETRRIKGEVRRKVASGGLVGKERRGKPRLYVDVSEVFSCDRGTGVQRVTREVSRHLKEISCGYEVVEVWCGGSSYFSCAEKKEIDFCRGDIFFVLDQSLKNVYNNAGLFAHLMKNGVRVSAFFHDLIPVIHPEFCDPRYVKDFARFFKVVLSFSSIVCNSESTARELKAYLFAHPEIPRNPQLEISHSLLGCDFSEAGSMPRAEEMILPVEGEGNSRAIIFLMVSTVEPRKMYGQALAAFDLLWKKDVDVRLWIVGRPGWKNKKTIAAIERHPELGKRLQWYRTGISDGELSLLYRRCDAVLFASLAEGFGLAVAEGAYFGTPLILRDIPVFREIAGENAFYFSGERPENLAEKIEEWLSLHKEGREPKPDGIRLPTWEECTERIFEILTEKNRSNKI